MKQPPLFTILDRYILGQLFQAITFSIVLFTVVWIAPETLFKLIQALFNHKITASQMGTMLLYHIPPVLQQSIPIATLLGSLFVFQKFSRQSEWIAFLSGGITPTRILAPVLAMGIFFTAVYWVVQENVTPKTSPILQSLYYQYDLKSKKDDNFVFVEKNQEGELDKFFLIGQTALGNLSDFIILYYAQHPDGSTHIDRILRAQSGEWDAQNKAWHLHHGIDYELDNEGVYQAIHRFDEQWVNTSKYPAKLLDYSRLVPLHMSQHHLRDYMKLLKEGGQLQDLKFFEVRFFQKWVFPLAAVFFVILGAWLGTEHTRSNRSYALTLGAVLLFFYSVLVPFSTNLGSLGFLPTWLAALVPLGFTLGLAFFLFKLLPRQSLLRL